MTFKTARELLQALIAGRKLRTRSWPANDHMWVEVEVEP